MTDHPFSVRRTLSSDEIIPDGVAKRLAREFGIVKLAATGEIWILEELDALTEAKPPEGCRDEHAWRADRAALVDYISAHGPRDPVESWPTLRESIDVVPWSYRGKHC